MPITWKIIWCECLKYVWLERNLIKWKLRKILAKAEFLDQIISYDSNEERTWKPQHRLKLSPAPYTGEFLIREVKLLIEEALQPLSSSRKNNAKKGTWECSILDNLAIHGKRALTCSPHGILRSTEEVTLNSMASVPPGFSLWSNDKFGSSAILYLQLPR